MKFKTYTITYIFFILVILSGYISVLKDYLIIITIHEFGHVFFLFLFKRKIKRIELYPFGLIIKDDALINSNIFQEFLITIGGILSQVIFRYCYLIPNNLVTLNSINNYIMFFNIIPIYPLDGYRILLSFTSYIFPYKYSLWIINAISVIFIIILAFSKSYSLFVVLFLAIKLVTNCKNSKYLWNKFILEHIIYDLNFKRNKFIKGNNPRKMFRSCNHTFEIGNNLVCEKNVLRNFIDK